MDAGSGAKTEPCTEGEGVREQGTEPQRVATAMGREREDPAGEMGKGR